MTWKHSKTRRLIGMYAVLLGLWGAVGLPAVAFAQAIEIPGTSVSTNDLWLLVYAILASLITSAITNLPKYFTAIQKRLICAAVSVPLAALSLYYAGRLDLGDLGKTWLIVFLVASGIYVTISRPIADFAANRAQT